MGGKKLDSSDLDDPAGGVKLINGKDSFLTPPAGSLSYTFIYARHIYKNSRKTTWELKRFLSSICAVVKYHFKIFFFCISFLLRPPSSSSTRHPVAVRLLKSAVDLGQDRLTRVGRLQKTVSRAVRPGGRLILSRKLYLQGVY